MKTRVVKRNCEGRFYDYLIQRKKWWGWGNISLYHESSMSDNTAFPSRCLNRDKAVKIAIMYASGEGIIKYKGYTLELVDITDITKDNPYSVPQYSIFETRGDWYRYFKVFGTKEDCMRWADKEIVARSKPSEEIVYYVEGGDNYYNVIKDIK